MNLAILYVTHETMEAARRVADHLLAKRLIACANLFEIDSAYFWKGEVKHSLEVVSLLKTNAATWELARDEVAAIHPYEVPCILKIDAEANAPFARWVDEELGGAADLPPHGPEARPR